MLQLLSLKVTFKNVILRLELELKNGIRLALLVVI